MGNINEGREAVEESEAIYKNVFVANMLKVCSLKNVSKVNWLLQIDYSEPISNETTHLKQKQNEIRR